MLSSSIQFFKNAICQRKINILPTQLPYIRNSLISTTNTSIPSRTIFTAFKPMQTTSVSSHSVQNNSLTLTGQPLNNPFSLFNRCWLSTRSLKPSPKKPSKSRGYTLMLKAKRRRQLKNKMRKLKHK